ncbi:MAG: extracellular solute-binding protein [Clostridia bacterium]|nr:extracellular solute-binding protein [Clostridia bacterium]
MIKRAFSLILVLVLICALAITATGCKTADVNTDDDKNMGDLVPGGVANVSAEVLEALSSSGDVTVYTNSDSETDYAKDFSEYFSQVYGGNLTRKYVEWEGWEKVFVTDFAAEEAPDVITLFYKLWPKVANRGMVYSIDELKELGVVGIDHPTFEEDVELCEKNYSYKKQNYSLALGFKSAVYCCVNTDLFKQYSVKSPVEYYNEGTWNYENFVKCCKELSRDSDLDDVIDVFGYTGWDLSWFVVANGGQLIRMDDKGNIYDCLDTLNVNNALKNVNQLSIDKCITREGDFAGGKVGMHGALKTNLSKPIGRDEITFNWDIVPFPYGPDNSAGGVMPGDINGIGIVTSTKNPQGALNYVIASRVFSEMTKGMYEDDEHMDVFNEQQLQLMGDYDNQTSNAFFMGVGSLWHAQWDFWYALERSKGNVSEVLTSFKPMFEQQCELEMDSAN